MMSKSVRAALRMFSTEKKQRESEAEAETHTCLSSLILKFCPAGFNKSLTTWNKVNIKDSDFIGKLKAECFYLSATVEIEYR